MRWPLFQSLAQVNIRRRLSGIETAITVVLKDAEVLLCQHARVIGRAGEWR
jgi:hypothetical protein